MNNLNVFSYGYYNWRCPLRNIKQFFRNIKYAYQRATRGFCDQDAWSLDSFYSELFYQTLNHLAENAYGSPYELELEEWQAILKEMAQHFYNSQEFGGSAINKEVAELSEKMHSYITNIKLVKVSDNASKMEYEYSDEEAYNKAKNAWLAKEKEASEYRQAEKDKACDMLKKYFFNLWD